MNYSELSETNMNINETQATNLAEYSVPTALVSLAAEQARVTTAFWEETQAD